MKKTTPKKPLLVCALLGVLAAGQALAADIRYMNSGDYLEPTGWQGGVIPGTNDTARFNWGNNTVTLSGVAPLLQRFQMGVDESGQLVVQSGGKLVTTGLWDKLGISYDEVHTSANSTMYTNTEEYTPAEWARFEAGLDRVYSDFTQKVADGRKLPKEKVLEIAKGRIWTGEDAKALGLVDELGGFPVALRLAKSAAGIPEKDDVKLELFPAKKGALDYIFGDSADSSDKEGSSESMKETLRMLQPAARQLRRISAGESRGVLSMPDLQVKR